MVPCKSTAEEVSFEWSHHRISSTDAKVITTLHVSIIDLESEEVNVLFGLRAASTTRVSRECRLRTAFVLFLFHFTTEYIPQKMVTRK